MVGYVSTYWSISYILPVFSGNLCGFFAGALSSCTICKLLLHFCSYTFFSLVVTCFLFSSSCCNNVSFDSFPSATGRQNTYNSNINVKTENAILVSYSEYDFWFCLPLSIIFCYVVLPLFSFLFRSSIGSSLSPLSHSPSGAMIPFPY